MSENRFSDCVDISGVLRQYRVWKETSKDVHADALARIRELTPPVVSDEVMKEARTTLAHYLDAAYRREASSVSIDTICQAVDNIVYVLGREVAEPQPVAVSEEARERAVLALQKYANCSDTYASALTGLVIDALGYTPAPRNDADHAIGLDGRCDACDPTPVSPPVVELAPDELRTLASTVETYEQLHTQLTEIAGIDHVPPYLDVFIYEGQSVRVVCDENGCWVLRIGGDQ